MKNFLLMLQFFTRIPLPWALPAKEENFARGIKYFPLVGLVIGCGNAFVYWLCAFIWPHAVCVVLVCLFNLLITGALHLDGLADTCDGLFSSRPRQKMLEIMRDSRIGTNGAAAIFFDLALRMVLLWRLRESWILQTLVAMPVLSRTAMVLLIATSRPARPGEGLGNLFLGKCTWTDGIIVTGIAAFVGTAILSEKIFPILGINLIVMLLYSQFLHIRLGGMTGDTLGAGNEVSEITMLLTLTRLAGTGT